MEKSIVIIDADSLIYITAYNNKNSSLEEAITSIDNFIVEIATTCTCTEVLLCLTIGGENMIRNKISTESRQYGMAKYKGKRKEEKPLYYKELKDHLYTKWEAFADLSYEADDLIFISRTKYQKEYPNARIVLAINDKDCEQYPGIFYNYRKKEHFVNNKERASQLFWTQMITGDITDNIEGIKGSGIKTAEKLLNILNHELYPKTVLGAYISFYGEELGIAKFYYTYKLLKLVDNADIEVPDPLKIDYGTLSLPEGGVTDLP